MITSYFTSSLLVKIKGTRIVRQFDINDDNNLVLCGGLLALSKEGVHKIELNGGTTVIDTETCKIMFSPMFTDDVICLLWKWIEDKDMNMSCKHTVSEALPWVMDNSHAQYLLRKFNKNTN